MKDAYYFPHDSNAKDDPKCVYLIEQLGPEGYGIYWILIEILRDQPGYCYPVSLLPAIARKYNTTFEKVKTVVSNYGLFSIKEDVVFFSESLIKRMIPLEEKRRKRSEAGKKGNISRWKSKGDLQSSQCDNNSIALQSQVKESKVKEIKEETYKEKAIAFVPPVVGDVYAYCKERNNSVNAEYFVDFYASKGWMVGKNKMIDWKAAVRTWEKSDNKSNNKSNGKEENTGKRYKFL